MGNPKPTFVHDSVTSVKPKGHLKIVEEDKHFGNTFLLTCNNYNTCVPVSIKLYAAACFSYSVKLVYKTSEL
jgi:hypothetical protein